MVYTNGATKHRTDKTVTQRHLAATPPFIFAPPGHDICKWCSLERTLSPSALFYGEYHALRLKDSMLLPWKVSPLPARLHLVAFHRLIILGLWTCGREKCCLSSIPRVVRTNTDNQTDGGVLYSSIGVGISFIVME